MSGFEFHLGFGPYEPEDEEPEVPEFLREPDQAQDFEGWAHETTADDGPVICGQGHCVRCDAEGLFGIRLWRQSEKHGRIPVWTLDGGNCPDCGGRGTLRARLVGPDEVG